MTQDGRPEWLRQRDWVVRVTPTRWGYWITWSRHPMAEVGDGRFRWTWAGARRCAQRGLDERRAQDRRDDEAWTVT